MKLAVFDYLHTLMYELLRCMGYKDEVSTTACQEEYNVWWLCCPFTSISASHVSLSPNNVLCSVLRAHYYSGELYYRPAMASYRESSLHYLSRKVLVWHTIIYSLHFISPSRSLPSRTRQVYARLCMPRGQCIYICEHAPLLYLPRSASRSDTANMMRIHRWDVAFPG